MVLKRINGEIIADENLPLIELIKKHKAALRGADLRWADLSGADLSGANISGANISGAKTDKKYYSVVGIGCRRSTTIYCVEDDFIWCGCWTGKLSYFKKRVEETHKDNKRFLTEYREAIKFFGKMKGIK